MSLKAIDNLMEKPVGWLPVVLLSGLAIRFRFEPAAEAISVALIVLGCLGCVLVAVMLAGKLVSDSIEKLIAELKNPR